MKKDYAGFEYVKSKMGFCLKNIFVFAITFVFLFGIPAGAVGGFFVTSANASGSGSLQCSSQCLSFLQVSQSSQASVFTVASETVPQPVVDEGVILTRGVVRYSDFSSDIAALTSGQKNAFATVIATHDFANYHGLPVEADAGARYLIAEPPEGRLSGATILTNTDWADATFIIDDTAIPLADESVRLSPIFTLARTQEPIEVTDFPVSLKADVSQLDFISQLNLRSGAMVRIEDSAMVSRKHFGQNAVVECCVFNKADSILVDQNGQVDASTPLLWDFNNIQSVRVLPFEQYTLKLTGGTFERIAQQTVEVNMSRNISISRDNVLISDFTHTVINASDFGGGQIHGVYSGTIHLSAASNVRLENVLLYGMPRSYDFGAFDSINISLINVVQQNDIRDREAGWGIMGCQGLKNLYMYGVSLSRIGNHRQVHNLTITNSAVGWSGILVTGSGKLLIEDTIVHHGSRFLEFREDWGSTWKGDVYIINSIWEPNDEGGRLYVLYVINDGRFDFGFPTYMPARITIDGFEVVGTNRQLHLVNNFWRLSPVNAINLPVELDVQNISQRITIPSFIYRSLETVNIDGDYTLAPDFVLIIKVGAVVLFVLVLVVIIVSASRARKRKRAALA